MAVLSLGPDLQSPSLSSQPPPVPPGEQTNLSGWWVLVGTDPLWGSLSVLPSAPMLLRSFLWLWRFPSSQPPSLAVKELPSMWTLFLLHSSLPDMQVLYLFFCLCFFFCPIQVRGYYLAFWEVWGLLPAFSRCPVGAVPHIVVFFLYLWGRRWPLRLTPPPSWGSSRPILYWDMFPLCLLPGEFLP